MASIRKAKKALKRKIRRIDEAIIGLSKHEGVGSAMWDFFLWRNYFERKLKYLGKKEPNPWTGDIPKISIRESDKERMLELIKMI